MNIQGGLFAETEKPKQKAKARAGSMFDDDADEENEDDNLSVGELRNTRAMTKLRQKIFNC